MKIRIKVLIVGAFDFEGGDTGGQPVKTRELYYALQERYGKNCIDYIETIGWKNKPIALLSELFSKARISDVIIMLPAQRGLYAFAMILNLIKKHNTLLFYDVIGGWLPSILETKKTVRKRLEHFDGIWVETTSMKESLELLGFKNIVLVPNFKKLSILQESELNDNFEKPLSLCTFSRVVKQKGIEDAINAVIQINTEEQELVFRLDIYGPIDDDYRTEFYSIMENAPEYIQYKGIADPHESVDVLKHYYALLFPTKFFTEGIPGTIIDAYCAGVPVIAPYWKNYRDVLIDGKTGWGYEFNSFEGLCRVIRRSFNEKSVFLKMKRDTLREAEQYLPNRAMDIIAAQIEGKHK